MGKRKGLAKTMAEMMKVHADDQTIDKIILVVKNHALAAAAAAVVAEVAPGGFAAAAVAAIGFICAMYYRICKELNLDMSTSKLKTIATAMVTYIAASYGVTIAANAVLNLIPGVNVPAAVLSAILVFALVYTAGVLFIMIITQIVKATGSIDAVNEMTDEEWVKRVKEIPKSDVKNVLKQAKREYEDVKNDPDTSAEGIEAMED